MSKPRSESPIFGLANPALMAASGCVMYPDPTVRIVLHLAEQWLANTRAEKERQREADRVLHESMVRADDLNRLERIIRDPDASAEARAAATKLLVKMTNKHAKSGPKRHRRSERPDA
jgi:hypothetical protein